MANRYLAVNPTTGGLTQVQATINGGPSYVGQLLALNAAGYVSYYAMSPVVMLDAALTNSQAIGSGFNTLVMNQLNFDNLNCWNPATNIYTVGAAGKYHIVSLVRYVDNYPGGCSYGQGVSTSNSDSSTFLWGVTATVNGTYARNGLLNVRVASLKAGDQLRLITYIDGAANNTPYVTAAQLSIYLLGTQ